MKSKTEQNLVKNSGVGNKIPKAKSEYAGKIVKIKDYDPAKHLVSVVDLENRPLEQDLETQQRVVQKKAYDQPPTKVLKTSDAADGPILEVGNSSVSMRGNGDYGYFSYREGGANIIKGPLSIGASADKIKVGGLHTLNPLAFSGFPSTIVTPIPTFLWALPSAAIIKPLLKDIAIMSTLIG